IHGGSRSRIGLARCHRPDLCRRIGLLLHAGGDGDVYARSESLFRRAATPRDLASLILRIGLCSRGRDFVRSLSQPSCQLRSPFPLGFLLLYGLNFVVSQDVIGEQVLLSFLKGFLPSLGEHVVKELHRVSALETVRWAVFLTFAWFGTLVFYELDYALNVVFESTWRRHPLISTGIAVALL